MKSYVLVKLNFVRLVFIVKDILYVAAMQPEILGCLLSCYLFFLC